MSSTIWKGLRRGALGGVGALVGALGVLGGCTEEQTGFFVLGNALVEAPDCIVRPEGNATLIISGRLDVGLTTEYVATLIVGNQLTPRGDKENLRTETMVTTITGAEVQLYTDTGELEVEFTVPATGVVLPSTSADPGFGVTTATLIPASTGAELAAELTHPRERRTRVAEVRVFGETIGGLEVESSRFTYVIRVCDGCLVDFPAEALNEEGLCLAASDGADLGNPPCRFGQDDSVDCRLCAGALEACGGGVIP